jgi:capsular exopolysaccharide synthesis family protein
LLRRRYVLLGSVIAAAVLGAVYLLVATRIYSATARVVVERSVNPALGDLKAINIDQDGLLQTQVEMIQSLPVLRLACRNISQIAPHTFANAEGDPAQWVRESKALKVEVGKKSDVIQISMESAYPHEAAAFVDAVVDAYLAESQRQSQAGTNSMLTALRVEKADKEQQRDRLIATLEKYRRDNGILQLDDAKGNTILDRATTLSTSLTTLEMQSMQIKAELAATQAALHDPVSVAALVESQQEKDKNSADQELNDLRNERLQYQVALDSSSIIQGSRNQHVQVLQSAIDAINLSIQQKERSMADAMVASLQAQLAATQQQEDELRSTLAKQTQTALGLSPETYANAQNDLSRLQKSLDTLDGRITELSVNRTTDPGPVTLTVMEHATLEPKPVKPNKVMVLAASMLVGLIVGMGAALVQEGRDLRIRSTAEIRSLLSARLVASIPPIGGVFSAVARGQIVRLDARSAVAEAYRSIRTALHLCTDPASKTLLFVSPQAAEGKSTTASNVALAFAQAGERTLLIDCDMRQPVQHMIFEVDSSVGLSDVINGTARLRDAVRSTEMPGLCILPCGPLPINPSELLASKRFNRLMQSLGKSFDRIIIDAPPLLSVTDGLILAAAADVTLLVLRMSHSMREPAQWSLEELHRSGANVLGVVANGVPLPRAYRYYGSASAHAYSTHASRRFPFTRAASDPGERGLLTPREPIALPMAIEEPEWAAD